MMCQVNTDQLRWSCHASALCSNFYYWRFGGLCYGACSMRRWSMWSHLWIIWCYWVSQALQLVDKGPLRRVFVFLRPSLSDKDIPRRNTIRRAILEKAQEAEEQICDKLKVCDVLYFSYCMLTLILESPWKSIIHLRCVDIWPWWPIPLSDLPLHRCTKGKSPGMGAQEWSDRLYPHRRWSFRCQYGQHPHPHSWPLQHKR